MQEIELKFQIPAGALAALTTELQALPGGHRPPQRLQAAYFDTADRRLARARAALRVRQEDDEWVQTLKAAGANAMTRLEDNRPYPAPGEREKPGERDGPIRPDLSLHVDEPVRQALVRDLGWRVDADPEGKQTGLLLLYRTDMRRLRAQVDTAKLVPRPAHAGEVEIALDLGEIAAGALRKPVREVEIELTGGHARAVIDVARGLVHRHGLWLDTQTKAHRGDQLAREADSGVPSPMPPSRPRARIKPGMSPAQAWRAGVEAALDQIGACFSEVALHAGTPPSVDPQAWIRGWATGLKRLGRVWRYPPATIFDTDTKDANTARVIQTAIAEQLATLRPRPGQWLDCEAASAFARATAPTLLALDVFELLVAMDA